MSELTVSVISPSRVLYEGEAESVTLPGEVGSFQVLKQHAPLVALLSAGLVTIKTLKGEEMVFVVDGGFCEVNNNKVSALVEGAKIKDEIDVAEERAKLDELLKKVISGDAAYRKAAAQVEVHRARIRAAS